ncbi:hypothetical protein ENSA5_06540 [Enhygromyxa salina]|uniref:Uncharacterized protein n=1 Tax=Enhygromyxa salina TaxID=215803 RepID=A0A2S9YHE9_9BACT|nr:hypothetical protein ENSA5_06540 [Enhygromyxa salina]
MHGLGRDPAGDEGIVGLDHGLGVELRGLVVFSAEQRDVGGALDRGEAPSPAAALDERAREVPPRALQVEHAEHLATGGEVHLRQVRVAVRVLPEGPIGVIGEARRADPRSERRQPAGHGRVGPADVAGRGPLDDQLADQLMGEAEAGLAGLGHEPAALEPRDRAADPLGVPARDALKPGLVDVAPGDGGEQREPALVEARSLDAIGEHALGAGAADLALAQRPRLGVLADEHPALDPGLQGRPRDQRVAAAGLVQDLGELVGAHDRAREPGDDHALELCDRERLEHDPTQEQLRVALGVPVAVVGGVGQARRRLATQARDDHRVVAAVLDQQAAQDRDRAAVGELEVVEQDDQGAVLGADRPDALGDRDRVAGEALLELAAVDLGRR